LTTQLTELKTEFTASKASKGTPKLDDGKPAGGPAKYVFEAGVSRRLITKLSTTWLNVTARPGIGVISTSTTTKVLLRMESMSLTNLISMNLGLKEETKEEKVVQRRRPEMTLPASPSLPQPNLFLTTSLPRSSPFQSRFRLHW
jgi:hypothetical protein